MGVYLGSNAVNVLGGRPAEGGESSAVLISKNITANGTYNASSDDADGYSSVIVNVSSGIDGNDLEYGLFDATSSRVGVGKVGSMIIK